MPPQYRNTSSPPQKRFFETKNAIAEAASKKQPGSTKSAICRLKSVGAL